MSKKIKGSYLLNAVGVALVFALLTGLFAANAFGTSTTYIQGICTTACYTIIMVTSLNLVVGFMGEFSLGPLYPARWQAKGFRIWGCS